MVRLRALLACAAASVIAGCAVLPEYREDAVTTADIVRNIKCELREAAWSDPANAWIQNWNAGLLLSLIVDHTGAVDADASWTGPLNRGATFVIALTGGLTGGSTRTERVDFKENLAALHGDRALRCGREDPGLYARLGGRIGISDLIERVGHMKLAANIDPKELTYNIDFLIKKSGTAGPKFNLIPIGKEKIFTGGLKWTGSRTDTHTLKIVLQPPPREEKCPVDTYRGRCPTLVYQVPVAAAAPPPGPPSSAPRTRIDRPPERALVGPSRPRGLTPQDEQRLDAAKGRNVLESIDDQLRRQGLGN